MGYYCNVCKQDITKAEFFYSIDKFDRPLCRKHQAIERNKRAQQDFQIKPEEPPKIENHTKVSLAQDTISNTEKSLTRKIAGAMGRGVVLGVKKIVRYSKKKRQIRKWKGMILRRMKMNQLKSLCFERKISTKKEVTREDKNGELYFKEVNCTKRDLVIRLKNRVALSRIINFAQRNRINISDILAERQKKLQEWKQKKLDDKYKKDKGNFLLELEKTIRSYRPFQQYTRELPYHHTLAEMLRNKYPSTEIEKSAGSTRPDIIVRGIAIEVKGPTRKRDLQTIADKCMRYPQHYSRGLICVLFKVETSTQFYKEWLEGMKLSFPDVKVIRR